MSRPHASSSDSAPESLPDEITALLTSGTITRAELAAAQSSAERSGQDLLEALTDLGLLRTAPVPVVADPVTTTQLHAPAPAAAEPAPAAEAPATAAAAAVPAPEAPAPTAPTPRSAEFGTVSRFLAEQWLIDDTTTSGTVVLLSARDRDTAWIAERETELGRPVQVRLTPSWELKNRIIAQFPVEVADGAANELHRRNPLLSARETFSRGQKVGGLILLAIVIVGLVLAPVPSIIVIVAALSLAFLAGTAFKFFVAMRGARFDVVERVRDDEVNALEDDILPTYTVLVPVFREANIVANLIDNLGGIDYPADRLEILILIEEEDDETRSAITRAAPPANMHVVTIPKGHPQTKPRACNVGLTLATGEFLVIYDAEDRPDPDQLKKALIAFSKGGPSTVCVQAALNYFNATENVLTRMFTLEYSFWFDYMLGGLDHAKLPIPLGGTSNHFRTSALRELGGWDPYNVTEDADLGIRASALGYRVGVINSTTMEEANTSIPNFIRQRSRWIKGYMQTSLIHARRPFGLIKEIGLKRFLAFVLLIGGTPLSFLAVLPLLAVTVISLFVPLSAVNAIFPDWVLWVTLLNFVIGNWLMVYLNMMGTFKRATFNLQLWALLNPIYWILHSIAAYKGLWQLLTKPHYWEKTDHGLTTQSH
ncbi:MAG: glycosyltransferase family 2 protein [Mycetocola sp.]